MDQRIKGQEVQVLLVVAGLPQDTITDIRNFEVAMQFDILSEGYLGETTNRRDEVFKGVRGKMELHFDNADVLKLMQKISARAQRREPGTKINIKATLNYPNGERPVVLINDAFFGEIPMSFGSRTDYGSMTLDFEASNMEFLNLA